MENSTSQGGKTIAQLAEAIGNQGYVILTAIGCLIVFGTILAVKRAPIELAASFLALTLLPPVYIVVLLISDLSSAFDGLTGRGIVEPEFYDYLAKALSFYALGTGTSLVPLALSVLALAQSRTSTAPAP